METNTTTGATEAGVASPNVGDAVAVLTELPTDTAHAAPAASPPSPPPVSPEVVQAHKRSEDALARACAAVVSVLATQPDVITAQRELKMMADIARDNPVAQNLFVWGTTSNMDTKQLATQQLTRVTNFTHAIVSVMRQHIGNLAVQQHALSAIAIFCRQRSASHHTHASRKFQDRFVGGHQERSLARGKLGKFIESGACAVICQVLETHSGDADIFHRGLSVLTHLGLPTNIGWDGITEFLGDTLAQRTLWGTDKRLPKMHPKCFCARLAFETRLDRSHHSKTRSVKGWADIDRIMSALEIYPGNLEVQQHVLAFLIAYGPQTRRGKSGSMSLSSCGGKQAMLSGVPYTPANGPQKKGGGLFSFSFFKQKDPDQDPDPDPELSAFVPKWHATLLSWLQAKPEPDIQLSILKVALNQVDFVRHLRLFQDHPVSSYGVWVEAGGAREMLLSASRDPGLCSWATSLSQRLFYAQPALHRFFVKTFMAEAIASRGNAEALSKALTLLINYLPGGRVSVDDEQLKVIDEILHTVVMPTLKEHDRDDAVLIQTLSLLRSWFTAHLRAHPKRFEPFMSRIPSLLFPLIRSAPERPRGHALCHLALLRSVYDLHKKQKRTIEGSKDAVRKLVSDAKRWWVGCGGIQWKCNAIIEGIDKGRWEFES